MPGRARPARLGAARAPGRRVRQHHAHGRCAAHRQRARALQHSQCRHVPVAHRRFPADRFAISRARRPALSLQSARHRPAALHAAADPRRFHAALDAAQRARADQPARARRAAHRLLRQRRRRAEQSRPQPLRRRCRHGAADRRGRRAHLQPRRPWRRLGAHAHRRQGGDRPAARPHRVAPAAGRRHPAARRLPLWLQRPARRRRIRPCRGGGRCTGS